MPLFPRAFAVACLLLMPAAALAQGARREPLLQQALRLAMSSAPLSTRPGSSTPLATRGLMQTSGSEQTQSRQRERSARRRIFGAAVGAAGGFFAGGYTGAWIEGDRCHCDDPGLKGALIGAPIGAVAGGILGGLYLF